MGFNQHRSEERAWQRLSEMVMELLPIPYTLTDFGRAQLAHWRAMEGQVAAVGDVHPSSETPRPRQ